MNSKKLFDLLTQRITLAEPTDEIRQLAFMVMEHALGLSANQILTGKEINFNSTVESQLNQVIERINRHEPIQYVLGKAEFFGRSFFVNSSVLIPRPETEELVSFVCSLNPSTVLDIGTGSGCIAISLKLEIPTVSVFATDISLDAIAIAKQNAEHLEAQVDFKIHDILQEGIPIQNLDVIVSNPPYITRKEIVAMKSNVLEYEPHLALFVEDDNQLLFYQAIAKKSKQALIAGGTLAVEINEHLGKEVAHVFASNGYVDISIRKDLNGKDRIVSARTTSL